MVQRQKQAKVTKLLAPTTLLRLVVDEGEKEEKVLELNLAWTMRGVIFLETKLRTLGYDINVLQNPTQFWSGIDCTKLAIGIWAMSQQEHPEYSDDEGFEVVSSYIVPDNYASAAEGLKNAFMESLSKKRRDEIKALEAKAVEPSTDPTLTPVEK